MRKISAVMTVYNEADLLPGLLANLSPHVDEIVAIDGSPEGPSTDGTLEILESHDKVSYKSDTYKMVNGVGWDMARQRNDGINLASGDIYLFVSADMLFLRLECLREAVEDERFKIFFCDTIEFWENTKKIRLYSADSDVLTLPEQLRQAVAVDGCFHPFWEDAGNLNLDGAELTDRAILAGTIKFHLGWIRSFKEQMAKHARNMRQGRRPDVDEKIMAGGPRKVEQWAIREAMGYEGIPSVGYYGELPQEMESLMGMKYNAGIDGVLKQYEEEHGISALRG